MRVAYVIPTRNREQRLRRTLERLASLADHDGEVIVIDNDSATPPSAPSRLDNGLPVRVIQRDVNAGAAARNDGARAASASAEWLVMLDDDSHPVDLGHLEVLASVPDDVAAVGAEIFLPGDRGREAGGLPEVIIGCGAAIRRDAFLETGGYDARFGYYAEEYDLCAKLMHAGRRIVHDDRFRVNHEKADEGRSMRHILRRLVRNTGWVMQRYAPSDKRRDELARVITRYGRIARTERAERGYVSGVLELTASLPIQPRRPLSGPLWDRFTGLAAARRSIRAALADESFETAALVNSGKNARLVRLALIDSGVHIVDDPGEADVLVPATLSPGPLRDAWQRHGIGAQRLVSPWHEWTSGAPTAATAG